MPKKIAKKQEESGLEHSTQGSLDRVLGSLITAPALLAIAFELKFKKAGVRLTAVERKRVRQRCERYFETEDASVLEGMVKRTRKIHIVFSSRDLTAVSQVVERAVHTTVTDVTRQLTESLEPKLRRGAAAYCAWSEVEDARFRKRTALTWRVPFQRFSQFRALAMETGEFALKRLDETGKLGASRLATALGFLHARACLVSGEVEALMRAGYADGAAARWRTLHEIATTASFLFEHGEETAERYLAHFTCENWRGALVYEKHQRRLGYGTLGKRYLKELEAQVVQLGQRYGDDFRHDYGWAAHALNKTRVTFANLEEATKRSFMRPFYRLASEQVHASPRGAIARGGLFEQDPTNAALMVGPSDYGFADAAQNSAHSLLQVTVTLASVEPTFDTNLPMLVLSKWLDPLQQSFVDVQKRMEARMRARRLASASSQPFPKGAASGIVRRNC